MTSLQVFRRHIARGSPGSPLDASEVISEACFEDWSTAHRFGSPTTEKFKRALLGHVTGVDGRVPFNQEEEAAVLLVVRIKQPWPLKENASKLGLSGFRGKGFHEKNALGKECLAKKQAKKGKKMLELEGESVMGDSKRIQQCEQPVVIPDLPYLEVFAGPIAAVLDTPSTPSFEMLGAAIYESTHPVPLPPNADPMSEVLNAMHSFFKDIPTFGPEVWTSMMDLGKILCLAKGMTVGASHADAVALCEQLSGDLLPSHALLMLDFTAKFEERIVHQNPRSIELVGNVCSNLGGKATMFIGEQHRLESFRAIMLACSQPGTEVHCKLYLALVGQETLQLMDVFYSWNKDLRLLIQRIAA
ncbi:hypothetical protein BASA81_008648 [Batrachochytrium salamandrivorans]|nr:hypothetical protein BASA81_008648 [Batrachochytrium salamandrivorans]